MDISILHSHLFFKIQQGKKVEYAYNDSELEEILASCQALQAGIQRYKGLGEMNPEQLWETTMDPETVHYFKSVLKMQLKRMKLLTC